MQSVSQVSKPTSSRLQHVGLNEVDNQDSANTLKTLNQRIMISVTQITYFKRINIGMESFIL